jgi:hypothetical protein
VISPVEWAVETRRLGRDGAGHVLIEEHLRRVGDDVEQRADVPGQALDDAVAARLTTNVRAATRVITSS